MIKSIFAVDYWGGMGNAGTLPWPHHREDMRYFQQQTKGHVVVMGRRTWDDAKMPKPLPDRATYVVTNRPWQIEHARGVGGDFRKELLKIERRHPDQIVWVIGGPKLLESVKDLIQEAHITHFKGQYKNDTKIDLRNFLSTYRCWSAKPSEMRDCNWSVYKNIDCFTPVT